MKDVNMTLESEKIGSTAKPQFTEESRQRMELVTQHFQMHLGSVAQNYAKGTEVSAKDIDRAIQNLTLMEVKRTLGIKRPYRKKYPGVPRKYGS